METDSEEVLNELKNGEITSFVLYSNNKSRAIDIKKDGEEKYIKINNIKNKTDLSEKELRDFMKNDRLTYLGIKTKDNSLFSCTSSSINNKLDLTEEENHYILQHESINFSRKIPKTIKPAMRDSNFEINKLFSKEEEDSIQIIGIYKNSDETYYAIINYDKNNNEFSEEINSNYSDITENKMFKFNI